MGKKGKRTQHSTKPKTLVTAAQIQNGPLIDPISRVFLYNSEEWESFIDEWVSDCLEKKYPSVQRLGGSNDKGIDIAGCSDDKLFLGAWDNYQCKHYSTALSPSDAWPEIAKVLWYSFQGDYKAPRTYHFIAPRGVGTTLSLYLGNAIRLREKLISVWEKNCSNAITGRETVTLSGDFKKHVDDFDLSIFKAVPIRKILDQHRETQYYLKRFGGGLPDRPMPDPPPEEIGTDESIYVGKLLAAYGSHLNTVITTVSELKQHSTLEGHFHRQREAFYHAEGLRVFVRDKVETGTFESLQDEIYNGVVDTRDADHADDYRRVVAVTDRAQVLPLDAHALGPSTFTKDKHGICQQLANDDRLKWVK